MLSCAQNQQSDPQYNLYHINNMDPLNCLNKLLNAALDAVKLTADVEVSSILTNETLLLKVKAAE